MNHVVEEMNELMHYGMLHRSGRYPCGSGENPYQHCRTFIGRVEKLKKQGWRETPENIMKEFGLTTTQYRTEKALSKDELRMYDVARAKSLKKHGYGASEIGRIMGINESTVRSLLNPHSEFRMNQARRTADFIKEQIDKKGMIDVGVGIERELNISKEKLDQALYLLEREGYPVYGGRVPNATNPDGKKTTLRIVCPPGTEHKEIYDYSKIHSLKDYISHDDGETFKTFVYPKSMDSNRLMIRYKEDGGIYKDGIVELRRGVDDLSLGDSHYAQVRILVDGNRYIKGMAVYSDNMPDGVDVIFNTNKSKTVPKMDVLKPIKEDPDNPFGSAIKPGGQSYYIDKNGKEQLSLINKRADEGDWTEWKDALPSQFLSKQSLSMAKKQLGLAIADKVDEYNEIHSLTNPTVKKHFLAKFADECDSAAVNLQAAALPGQKYHVIIPINTLKDNEVYAPGYDPGTKLALIRYPHGGTFEIPILTVNNKNQLGKEIIGNASIDAIGINKKNADRLSGADFDGDTVMCIPTHDGKTKVTSTPMLKGLEGFDPKDSYGTVKKDDGYYNAAGKKIRVMSNTQTQMGVISNLITDMTLKGANTDELAAAVRHSMVVIDAEKHKLDYRQSELDNNIAYLKKSYQSYVGEDGKQHTGGASTLISRAKGQVTVLKRQGSPIIDPETGKVSYKLADDVEYTVPKINKKTGEVTREVRYRTQKSTRMAETDDARTLISDLDTSMERAYADYANKMKAMANQARKEMMSTGKIAYSSSAKETYKTEVSSLMAKLNTALLNAPRERQAQVKANAEVNSKLNVITSRLKKENPNLTDSELRKLAKKEIDVKKASQQALSKYRTAVGSVTRKERNIDITDKEWEAIQAGAISESKLKQILNNADVDKLRQRAMPKASTTLSQGRINRIKSLSASGYTLSEIANKLGVSTSTVSKYLKGVN